MGARVRFLAILLLVGAVVPAKAQGVPSRAADCRIDSISFKVNGVRAPLLTAGSGDRVTVTFEVPDGCERRLSLASFVAPAPAFDGSKLDDQVLVGRERGSFGPGRHSLTVRVFDFPPVAPQACQAARAEAAAERGALRASVRRAMAASPTYRQQVADEVREVRATGQPPHPAGPYAGSCDATAAGQGRAGGKPCDGCVGTASDTLPPGQVVPGTDTNAGFRCDRNKGIGDGNPAHPGCPNFQLDFAYGDRYGGSGPWLIAGVFCVRAVAECYVTDRTGSEAVVGSHVPASRRP